MSTKKPLPGFELQLGRATAFAGTSFNDYAGEVTLPLAQYKHKRDFTKTPEPRGRVSKSHRKSIFVVQEHHASRLHYDFRLEADGVLKSWAIPKKPTADTSAKRLAVHVEDHPLEYAKFSGEIPEGEYGAGKVKIWDKGTYQNLLEDKPRSRTVTEGIKDGHLEVKLRGRKLKGGFALVRMDGRGKKDNWLLIKMKGEEAQRARKRAGSRKASPKKGRKLRVKGAPPKSIEFTHEDKIMFPEVGITKGEVLRFYERIADRLLPHLRDRPMTLERLPDGLAGKKAPHFWQKDTPSHYPRWIPRIAIPSENGEHVNYALVNDVRTLLYLVNQGTLTFHPWLSRTDDLDRPDFVLFDLDPGKAMFSDVVVVAKQLGRVLKDERIECFVKTSGKTGLHVLVQWRRQAGYDEARDWAMNIAERVVAALPETATVERRKTKRRRRVYVDVMQNVRGHHAVPPYVLRAVPEATVSTPLRWNELTPELKPQAFNLKTIFRRLGRQKNDPIGALVKSYGKHVQSSRD